MKITDETKRKFLTVYIPDTRGVTISRWGRGNLKIGLDGVYTYSRLPGHDTRRALGMPERGLKYQHLEPPFGTCPGATPECQAICYAARPVAEQGAVYEMWTRNSATEDVPIDLPNDAKIVRIHVSGDFTSERYIAGWYDLISRYPHVRFFGYTRSWRVPHLLSSLEKLRTLPNLQLFASMDKSTFELPPSGWRRAWIENDERLTTGNAREHRSHQALTFRDPVRSYTCPEETGHKPNCESCRYCIDGKRGDVTFLKH